MQKITAFLWFDDQAQEAAMGQKQSKIANGESLRPSPATAKIFNLHGRQHEQQRVGCGIQQSDVWTRGEDAKNGDQSPIKVTLSATLSPPTLV